MSRELKAVLDEDTMTGITLDTSVDIGDTVQYSNSIVNIGKTVALLGNEYDVMQYNKTVLTSTDSPGSSTVMIGLWQDVDITGGNPDHIVGLLGQAQSSDASTATTCIGTEGKVYANVDGSTCTSLLGFAHLNAVDNSNSVVYGLQAISSALTGSGTGISIAGAFNASGGGLNVDILLGGSQSIGSWNSTYSGLNYVKFKDSGVELESVADVKCVGTSGAFYPPQLTTTQRDALTPGNGMMIYNTTTNNFEGYRSGSWQAL